MVETIKQKSIEVDLGDIKTQVHRLRWKATAEFLQTIPGIFVLIIKSQSSAEVIETIVKQLPELAVWLVQHATTLTREQIDDLDLAQMAFLVQKSVEITFDDELKKSSAGIGAALEGLVPANLRTILWANFTPTSSKPDTTPPISTPVPT